MRGLYIEEAMNFLNSLNILSCDDNTPEALLSRWNSTSADADAVMDNPHEYYKEWVGERGASAIIANICDQFSRQYILYAILKYVRRHHDGCLLDYGCGTGALSISFAKKYGYRVTLADLPNLSREFTQRMGTKWLSGRVQYDGVELSESKDNAYDAIMCIDVLEHLTNPSEVMMLLNRKLRRRGILILQAPWGGHPEHLPEAPLDWFQYGGASLLASSYACIEHLDPHIRLSGVYIKR